MRSNFILIILLALSALSHAQTRWFDPQLEQAAVHGRALADERRTNYYQRLPERVKSEVRDAVWSLSRNTAGESIQFYTNSSQITVRYTLDEGYAMPHMPATGKSGVDLYAYDENGRQKWAAARYSFGDTVTFRFAPLLYSGVNHNKGYEYHLYLPPYNSVKWLAIGVDSSASFTFIKQSVEKPIIVYGTSIAQGACASRPGMIWSSIVSRELRTPLVNLGFSGNGRLEKGILDVIKVTPAKAVILDCMPNLMDRPADEITALVINAVREIRSAQPTTPILIADHLGYPHSTMIGGWQQKSENSIRGQRAAYEAIIEQGIKEVYYLSYDEIGMPEDGTVEAIHPSDYGMRVYADAYVKKLREILHEPVGVLSVQQPVTQRREPDMYEWRERHESLLRQIRQTPPSIVIFGNSITHYWGGVPDAPFQRGADSWDKKIAPLAALNMGFGWDRIENVLWRVYHGALDGYDAKKIIVAIGVNNILNNSDSQLADGMRTLVNAIKERQPQAEIVINGIYPARNLESRIEVANTNIAAVARQCGVGFNDFGKILLGGDGKINEKFFTDGLHPNGDGYRLIANRFIR